MQKKVAWYKQHLQNFFVWLNTLVLEVYKFQQDAETFTIDEFNKFENKKSTLANMAPNIMSVKELLSEGDDALMLK